jgi:hypothetical protein
LLQHAPARRPEPLQAEQEFLECQGGRFLRGYGGRR